MKPIALSFLLALCSSLPASQKPNVILIMTDDHGFGDIAAHGHPHLKTPNMDRLHRESVRLHDFHVDPTCSPTRSALMTGRYSARVGVWHTTISRYMLREDETTAAELFKTAGYRTGIFGKWHLGDNYPYAPRFRGFDESLVIGGGGAGQTPDFWGNDYFDDHYKHNGTWKPFKGYCTDVWFREAIRFIDESKDKPFFLYLPTNVAHQTRPHAPQNHIDRYKDIDTSQEIRTYWAMLDNFDQNLGTLLEKLETSGLLENTIIVFMSDNGSCMGQVNYPKSQQASWEKIYNVGMRENKGSIYDGGHRVHCFIRHPASGLRGGTDVKRITAHIDILPTLLELTGIQPPTNLKFDGSSLVTILKDPAFQWHDRTLVVHSQRVVIPEKWRNTAVMTEHWRLINNRELYDIKADPGQKTNLIKKHPEAAATLAKFYDGWWDDVSSRNADTSLHYIGAEQENPIHLNAHDWLPPHDGALPWNQPMISQRAVGNGTWHVRVIRPGPYAITLRERPAVANFPLRATQAQLRIGSREKFTMHIPPNSTSIRFELDLPEGPSEIQSWLIEPPGKNRGAYFVEVEFLGKGN